MKLEFGNKNHIRIMVLSEKLRKLNKKNPTKKTKEEIEIIEKSINYLKNS